ncbi:peptidoglycan recognition family protein [Variovorax sp. J22R133]|uniref:peptidoglycan recognition protein family protein n=1 Tax=Variovorax brevis TaxID=3053503 RepID=UPI002578B791|nr:peptidoglycan recognition family protein [Variovorax sp. J22R133]MDM0112021.1 peptidoglycan recognition family protein [Variovorax sp. J22R133]
MDRFEILPLQGESGFGDLIGRIGSGIGAVASRVADVIGSDGIVDLTAQSDKSIRKGARDMKKVHALVLHQMACCFQRKDPMRGYLGLKAHFAILPDGRILKIHPVEQLIWSSNGFNAGSVAVEFAGNFPNVKGKWWEGDKFGRNRVTPAQIEAGRRLIRHLIRTMGLRTVLAHRQSSATRENDPGPDIWSGVGQWAVDTLGLKDGGPGFKVGDGNPIPDVWRTWGRTKPAPAPTPPTREYEFGELGELEQETFFGPVTATLKWMKKTYTRTDVVKNARGFGGVYIAFQEPAQKGGKIKILKVGMTGTFARRMADKKYVDWDKQPGLRFYLAEVRGNRHNRGIGGVVRMVEFALARLLRRAGELTGKELPKNPSVTKGAVKITNILPDALVHLLDPGLRKPVPAEGGTAYTGTITPGQLTLPVDFNWEAEQAFG